MSRMLAFLAAGIGGWVGWAIGDPVSLFVAVLLSAVGTGVGLWGVRRLTEDYF